MSSHSRRAVALAAAAGLLLADVQPVRAAVPVWNQAPCLTVNSMKDSATQDRRVGCVTVTVGRTDDGPAIAVRPLHHAAPLVEKDVVETPYTGVHFPESMEEHAGLSGACGTCY